MQIYKTKTFTKWANKENITDNALKNAVIEMEQGLMDAELGGHVYKKRIGSNGRGKREGARTLIVYKFADKAFFIYGFMKNERENISTKEQKALRLLADQLLNYSLLKLQIAISKGELNEIN